MFSTISLTDDYADTRTWQLVDESWIFDKANIKFALTKLTLDSPLKQIKAGIPLDEIKCKDEFVLAIKNSDDSSACVKPETKIKLIEHGWAKPT